jgi:hypothetical protein
MEQKKNKYIKIADIRGMEKTSYTNTKLSRKTKYTYRIKAYTSTGNKIFYSITSEKASARHSKAQGDISSTVSKVNAFAKYVPRWEDFTREWTLEDPMDRHICCKSGKSQEQKFGYQECSFKIRHSRWGKIKITSVIPIFGK